MTDVNLTISVITLDACGLNSVILSGKAIWGNAISIVVFRNSLQIRNKKKLSQADKDFLKKKRKKAKSNTILNDKRLIVFHLRSETKQGCLPLPRIFMNILEVLNSGRKIKKIATYVFADAN